MRPNSKEINGVGDYYNAYQIPLHEPFEIPRELLPERHYSIDGEMAERQDFKLKKKEKKSGGCFNYFKKNKWDLFLYFMIFLFALLFFGQSANFFWLYYSRK